MRRPLEGDNLSEKWVAGGDGDVMAPRMVVKSSSEPRWKNILD